MQDNSPARAFVTGGAGFIGGHLVDRLLTQGMSVTVYDHSISRKSSLARHAGRPGLQIVEGDVLNLDSLVAAMQGHTQVWHLAANGDIRLGHQHTDLDIHQSILGTRNVLECMRAAGIQDLLFSSSGSVYGNITIVPTPETAGPLLPLSLYAASKLGAEAIISSFCSLFDLRAWIFRFGNVIGAGMSRGVIYDLIHKLRANPKELQILGDGQQEKPYFLVSECLDGMLCGYRSAPLSSEHPCDIFNLGTPATISVRRIAEIIVEEMRLPNVEFRFSGQKGGWPGDQTKAHLECEKMAALGWRSSKTSEEAVREATRTLISEASDKSGPAARESE